MIETVSAFVRPVALIGLLGAMVYLALWEKNEKAQDALLVQVATLAGAYFGERAALKKPGDNQGG